MRKAPAPCQPVALSRRICTDSARAACQPLPTDGRTDGSRSSGSRARRARRRSCMARSSSVVVVLQLPALDRVASADSEEYVWRIWSRRRRRRHRAVSRGCLPPSHTPAPQRRAMRCGVSETLSRGLVGIEIHRLMSGIRQRDRFRGGRTIWAASGRALLRGGCVNRDAGLGRRDGRKGRGMVMAAGDAWPLDVRRPLVVGTD